MSKERLSSNAELYISLMMFLVAGILGWQITRITVAQSRLFPLFIFFLMTACAVVQLWFVVTKREVADMSTIKLTVREGVFIAALVLTYPLYGMLGFYATTLLLAIILSMITIFPSSFKTNVLMIAYSIVLVLICYVCFAVILGMQTPVGVLL